MRLVAVLSSFFLLMLVILVHHDAVSGNEVEVIYTPKTMLAVNVDTATVSARAFGIFDPMTGRVLAVRNADDILPLASVTKLFAAATLLPESVNDDERIPIAAPDTTALGEAGDLEVGETYSSYELLFPLLLTSSNDAARALERRHGDLVGRMQALVTPYTSHLQFGDASGLSDTNRGSVSGLVSVVSHLYQDMPHLFAITTLRERMTIDKIWINNNPVYATPYLQSFSNQPLPIYKGGKHGYTEAAGRTIVALFEEEIEEQMVTLGYILLGSDDLVADLRALQDEVRHTARFE